MNEAQTPPPNQREVAKQVVLDCLWQHPPWKWTLHQAGLRQVGYTTWHERSTGHRYELPETGPRSCLQGEGRERSCEQVLVEQVFQGDKSAAALTLLRLVIEQGRGGESHGLPGDFARAVRADLVAAEVDFEVIEALSREADAVQQSEGERADEREEVRAEDATRSPSAGDRTEVPVPPLSPTAAALGLLPHPPGPVTAVRDFLVRFVVLPEAWCYDVLALWAAHTFLMPAFDTTPRLALLSPLPGSGKTHVLDLLNQLVLNPLQVVGLTQAALFRGVKQNQGQVTLLLDEVDALLGARGSADAEQIRSILNGGYKRGGAVVRAGSKQQGYQVEEFQVFAPVALAGLGQLPTSLQSRCIVFPMRPRRRTEHVERYVARRVAPEAALLRDDLNAWATSVQGSLSLPELPEEISDRAAEIWEPLLMVADAAGPTWAAAARVAAITAVTDFNREEGQEITFLKAVRDGFDEDQASRLPTRRLLALLDAHDRPGVLVSDAQALAAVLQPFGIRPQQFRHSGEVVRGYERSQFEDVWERYLM